MHILLVLLDSRFIGLFAIFFCVLWMLKDEKDKSRPLLVLAVVTNLFFGTLLHFVMATEGAILPWKYDHVLYQLDTSLGFSAAAVARSLQHVWLIPLYAIYELMVPMMICWFLVTRRYGGRSSIIWAYTAELVAGPLMYAVLPACGPVFAFGPRWLYPPVVHASPIQLIGFPNAFPSLHVGTALVFVLFAPGKIWRGVGLGFLAGTAMATLTLGEHYVIDLVPGLAFGCFAANAALRRVSPAARSLAVVLCWSLGVRFGYTFLIAHPVVTGSFVAATVLYAAFDVFRVWSAHNWGATNAAEAHSGSILAGRRYELPERGCTMPDLSEAVERKTSRTSPSSVRAMRIVPEGSSSTE